MIPTCYVCFDGDKDIHYYRLMTAWNENTRFNFNFKNAHDITQARDSSTEETIKRSLRLRLNASDILIVLVGESTKNLYKYVRWEIEVAKELGMSIIVVNLNGQRQIDFNRCPPILRDVLAVHVSFNAAIINYALYNWPQYHTTNFTPHRYVDNVYTGLGL